ncbi:LysR family transcriptional regulator [Sorangium sp. So ce1024]
MSIENIDHLRVLVETARRGTLTAAARVLGVTPATASAMLKRLEAQLGERLFERSTRALRLTPEGQILLDYAARVASCRRGCAPSSTSSRRSSASCRLRSPVCPAPGA